MATDLIRYDVLVQQALRSVVRKVLADGARDGLPGSHHFYVSFDTNAPGVKITNRLHMMYPEEMTIVLQHQFWDLSVSDTGFEVSLSFEKIPERLIVPFDAVTGFFDPSVKFGLKFEAVTAETDESDAKPAGKGRKGRTKSETPEEPVQIGRKPKAQPKETPGKGAPGKAQPEPATAGQEAAGMDVAGKDAVEAAASAEQGPQRDTADANKDGAGAEVVSLDAFRKKK